MKRSTQRILTTHTGSLPRPQDLVELLWQREAGDAVNHDAFDARVAEAVNDIVAAQTRAGIDIVNDGEAGKVSYFSYVVDRLSGFAGSAAPSRGFPQDLTEFPNYMAVRETKTGKRKQLSRPVCTEPIAFRNEAAVQTDIRNLQAAAAPGTVAETFLSSASPGLIAMFLRNEHYPTREAYLFALADAMKTEYDAITEAGILLQLDCPDLAFSYNAMHFDEGIDAFRRRIAENIAALNHATRDIPPERMRMHLCWGNYEGPHHHDIPLKDIIDVILTARPAALSFEGANPRHQHEYALWDEVDLPEGKLIMPGVIDSTTNFIEHPELVAQRIVRYAERVGRENVIPGSDCGFGTGAGLGAVDTDIVWAKLGALAEGARLASDALWP
jgi:5-methyltetrahydropteroyltriglutamate--homocysteine methyltransferase